MLSTASQLLNTWRNDNIIITSKRRRDNEVLAYHWRYDCVVYPMGYLDGWYIVGASRSSEIHILQGTYVRNCEFGKDGRNFENLPRPFSAVL